MADPFVVPRDALVAEVRRLSGLTVTQSQLRRWCDVGLVLRPKRRGLGRGRGVVALYHPVAVWQAFALAQFLNKRRDLDMAGWFTWICGFPVTPFVRSYLLDHLEEQERTAKKMTRALARPRFRDDLVRRANRLGLSGHAGVFPTILPERLPTMLRMYNEAGLGTLHEHKYSEQDWELLKEGALSLYAPDDSELLDADDLASPQELEEGMNRMSREFPVSKVMAALKRIDDATLEALRTEAQAFAMAIHKALGQEPREMLPDEFLNYFSRAFVASNGAEVRREIYELMDWKQLPPTMVQQWILRRLQKLEAKRDK